MVKKRSTIINYLATRNSFEGQLRFPIQVDNVTINDCTYFFSLLKRNCTILMQLVESDIGPILIQQLSTAASATIFQIFHGYGLVLTFVYCVCLCNSNGSTQIMLNRGHLTMPNLSSQVCGISAMLRSRLMAGQRLPFLATNRLSNLDVTKATDSNLAC